MTTSLDVAADVALRLAGAVDEELDAVVTETLALLASAAQADRSYVTLYDEDGTFDNSHEWTRDGVVPQRPAIQGLRSEDFPYSCGMACRNEVLAAPDLMALPPEADAEKRSFASFGVAAVLQVPIMVNAEVVGLVGFNYFRTEVEWSDDLIQFIRRVGQAIGVALLRERAARSIRRAYDAAAKANRARDVLFAHVSHELRTPLHAILGYSELLELDERSAQGREALLQIQLNGHRLLTMVEDLISIADELVERTTTDVELAPLVGSVVDSLAPVTTHRQIDVSIEPALSTSVAHGELGRLRQVLHCALSGAVQSIGGGGEVDIQPAGLGRSGLRLRISSREPFDESRVVMPMARALIDGHGSIDLERRDDRLVDVLIRFERPAAADAQLASP